jgi:glyoxalase family protein
MDKHITGIHHVTAIAGDPQNNIDFYTGVLGLRLVKLTVNFDDPGTYHFYYGDGAGSPGTILTFFPWPGAVRGQHGVGQVRETAFAVPKDALDFWSERLTEYGIAATRQADRFGEGVIAFEDPDGLRLEIIGTGNISETVVWQDAPVSPEFALRGFHSVTLPERFTDATGMLLTHAMGLEFIGEEDNRRRYRAHGDSAGQFIDVLNIPEGAPGRVAVGTIHHLAWRTASDVEQEHWQNDLSKLGLGVSSVMDRIYFHSIYYREPGGALFEIATDPPGFTFDETLAELGSHLRLPPWLETARSQIEQAVPPISLHAEVRK